MPKHDKSDTQLTRRGALARIGGAIAAGAIAQFPAPLLARTETRSLKIGMLASISGLRSDFGAVDSWIVERVQKSVANGLDIGGTNYAVEIIVKDNQSDPNQTAVAARDLVLREKCDLILTDDGDNSSGAAAELADARGVPMISTLSPWEAWVFGRHGAPDKGFPFTFHYCIGAGDVFKLYTDMWNGMQTNKKVGTIYMDSAAARGFADRQHGLPVLLQKNGYTEVNTGFFQLNNDDFTNQIAELIGGDVGILSGSCYPNHFATFWNQAAQNGFQPEAVTVAGPFLFPSALEGLGDLGDGMSTEVLWNPALPYKSSMTGQSARELADEFEQDTGAQWTQPLGISHSLWEVGFAALRGASDPKDNKSIRDSIASLKVDTVVGPLDFAGSPVKNVAIQKLVGGQWRKTKDGKFPFELVIVNAGTSGVTPTAELVPLSKIRS
ncbi:MULTISPECIES: ABC transporter substrate-binding protein [Rhizobium]|uniref:Branched-chain amino acid transport system substrate-binding protein n=2 Tax=Rhizobium tropici TaxID=398 RepID=A0ABR6QUY4_RHITR|nr:MULTISPECIES: ABC transporter substrate-binding protein [Rhizobium]AGB74410.1 putative hydrophobic amino acid ABC transporter, substrate-binding protein [Rhizobium tropici CIAT 899]MBB4240892.1 branched-chain amino acid transport system substrate-binding protein [Rhizobium tropici]MBB5591692.1 branched-chain amino acid transport system substrate-binding protein [Rhizobium tropici]MBB6490745.1 branched-chain amino acid transport system substrate-binding protein [Rhizobium tropici]